MLKILLPVDGSPSAVRATESLIETIGSLPNPRPRNTPEM